MSFRAALSVSRAPLAALVSIGVFWGCLVAMIPVIQPRVGLGDAGLGVVLFLAAGGSVLAMWLAPVIDRALGCRSLLAAAAAFACAAPFVGWAGGIAGLSCALVAAGLTAGLLDIIANARVGDLEALHDRSLMNLNHASYSLAYAVSALLTGLLREAGWSPEAIFAAAAAGNGVLALLIATVRLPRGDLGAAAASGRPVGPVIWGLGLVCMVGFFAENATETWSALHIERTLGGRAAEGALGPAMLGVTMGIGRLLGHAITPRGREMEILRWGGAIAAGGLGLAAFAPGPLVAFLGFGILGIGASVVAPLALALAGQWAGPGQRTLSISRAAFVGYFGFFLGPPLLGVLSEVVGLRGALGIAALLLLSIPLVLLPLVTRRRAAT